MNHRFYAEVGSPSPFRRFAPPSLSHWEREGARAPQARGKGEGEVLA